MAAWAPPPDQPHTHIRKYFLTKKRNFYQRGPMLKVDFRFQVHKLFIGLWTPAPRSEARVLCGKTLRLTTVAVMRSRLRWAREGGGGWLKAMVSVWWRRLLASRHCARVSCPGDPPKPLCWPPRFCFSKGKGGGGDARLSFISDPVSLGTSRQKVRDELVNVVSTGPFTVMPMVCSPDGAPLSAPVIARHGRVHRVPSTRALTTAYSATPAPAPRASRLDHLLAHGPGPVPKRFAEQRPRGRHGRGGQTRLSSGFFLAIKFSSLGRSSRMMMGITCFRSSGQISSE